MGVAELRTIPTPPKCQSYCLLFTMAPKERMTKCLVNSTSAEFEMLEARWRDVRDAVKLFIAPVCVKRMIGIGINASAIIGVECRVAPINRTYFFNFQAFLQFFKKNPARHKLVTHQSHDHGTFYQWKINQRVDEYQQNREKVYSCSPFTKAPNLYTRFFKPNSLQIQLHLCVLKNSLKPGLPRSALPNSFDTEWSWGSVNMYPDPWMSTTISRSLLASKEKWLF